MSAALSAGLVAQITIVSRTPAQGCAGTCDGTMIIKLPARGSAASGGEVAGLWERNERMGALLAQGLFFLNHLRPVHRHPISSNGGKTDRYES